MVVHPHLRSPDPRWMTGAPFRDSLELGAYDTAPGTARGTPVTCWPNGLGQLRDVAELVISELVTNSAQATEAVGWPLGRPPIRLWLRGDPHRVCVWPGTRSRCCPCRARRGRMESGRGLGSSMPCAPSGLLRSVRTARRKVTGRWPALPWPIRPGLGGAAGRRRTPHRLPYLPATPPHRDGVIAVSVRRQHRRKGAGNGGCTMLMRLRGSRGRRRDGWRSPL